MNESDADYGDVPESLTGKYIRQKGTHLCGYEHIASMKPLMDGSSIIESAAATATGSSQQVNESGEHAHHDLGEEEPVTHLTKRGIVRVILTKTTRKQGHSKI